MYYNFTYWRERVPRAVPPPPIHYRRVRAVYALFGAMKDETGKPLFNDTAWKKARGVLKEILAGHAADLPNVEYYHQRLNKKGEPAVDADGLPLIDCKRGSNDVELVHKNLTSTWGEWVAGVEMSDCLLAEFRHRYNHHQSERRRLGFPKVGHYDTWLLDSLQLLVEANHGVLLYPNWSNTSNFKPTAEGFGTVPLHSAQLGAAIEAINVDLTKVNLSSITYLSSIT